MSILDKIVGFFSAKNEDDVPMGDEGTTIPAEPTEGDAPVINPDVPTEEEIAPLNPEMPNEGGVENQGMENKEQ